MERGFGALRRGGHLITFGNPGYWLAYLGMARVILMNSLPNKKSGFIYGIFWFYYKKAKEPILEDMATVFKLLEEGKIKPNIVEKLPITEGRKANEMMEGHGLTGKIVLVP